MMHVSLDSVRSPRLTYGGDTLETLLAQVRDGHSECWNEIYGLIYGELKEAAQGQLRHYPLLTMTPTLLVNETWLRINQAELDFNDRRHLMGLFVQAMRYVLVDEVRRIMSLRRGGTVQKVDFDSVAQFDLQPGDEGVFLRLLSINQALESLEKLNPRLAQIAIWRYFGGLTDTEIARYLGVTTRTVVREWQKSRAFLLTQMQPVADRAVSALS